MTISVEKYASLMTEVNNDTSTLLQIFLEKQIYFQSEVYRNLTTEERLTRAFLQTVYTLRDLNKLNDEQQLDQELTDLVINYGVDRTAEWVKRDGTDIITRLDTGVARFLKSYMRIFPKSEEVFL